ncbi:MAG: hypothetical protein OXH53_15025 [bacterium]|nr:hypothetical protein [bacterium]MCY3633557.1 hypothetical protein [bacterium]
MSDAIAFLLILPSLVLGVVILDAAGTLGTARYRTSTFSEAAAVTAAATLAHSPAAGAEPSVRARWGEAVATVEQSGVAATAGVCNQTDSAFNVSLISQPRPPDDHGHPPSVAAVITCPVELGRLLKVNRIVAASVEPIG